MDVASAPRDAIPASPPVDLRGARVRENTVLHREVAQRKVDVLEVISSVVTLRESLEDSRGLLAGIHSPSKSRTTASQSLRADKRPRQTAIPFLIGTKFDTFSTFPRDEQEEITKQVSIH